MIFPNSFPTKLRSLSLVCSSILVLTACSTEYSASDISVSDQGAFVERGSDDQLDGVVLIEKNTGERLSVEFSDGMPNGDVEMRDAAGRVILQSQFVANEVQQNGAEFMNEILEKNAASLGTDDYLSLFEEFAEYNGDYLEIDSNHKKIQGHYDEGEKINRWQVYCENEQLQSDRTFSRKAGDSEDAELIKVSDELLNTCAGDVLLSAKRDKEGRLQGAYVENSSGSWLRSADSTDKPLPKYQRNYIDGEFDGEQKEFDRYGLLKVENQYEKGVKQGTEKIYSSNQNYQTKAQEHWLAEVKNYANGQLNGRYTRFDKQQWPIESGQYQDDQASGTWTLQDHTKHTQQLVDFDSSNFITEKAKAFQEACYLPKSGWNNGINWGSNYQGDLKNCEYYVGNSIVDINKKLGLDVNGPFKKSANWTYAAIVAAPKAYAYMKKHGLKTRVSDSSGRTRLHVCLTQLRAQNRTYVRCTAEQAIAYMSDVDINHVSNIGTALHQLSLARNYSSRRPEVINAELKIAQALIDSGADVDRVNHQKASALMAALSNREYALAEIIIDAGASVSELDIQSKSTLAYFFLDGRNRWLKSKTSAQGTRVLAKMIALGVDTDAVVFDNKTVRDFSEEHNTLHHIQTLKDANAMSSQFKDILTGKLEKRRATKPDSTKDSALVGSEVSVGSEISSTPIAPLVVGESLDNKTPEVGQSVAEKEQAPAIVLPEAAIDSVEVAKLEESRETTAGNDGDRAQRLLQEQADFLVIQAREHIANLRLKTPKSNSALGSLEQLKRIDPQSPAIAEIEKEIGDKYLSLASAKIRQGDKAGAQKHVTSASLFIADKEQLKEYQARVDGVQAKRVKSVSKAPTDTSKPSRSAEPAPKANLICKPVVKVIGVPLLGRTLIARQSLPMSKQEILRKSLPWIQRDYSNVQQRENSITFEQATKRKPITVELEVLSDGNNTQLSVTSKTPPGFVVKKSAYKNTFCELLATF